FFFSSRRRHTRFSRDWSSDVCSSDLSIDLLLIVLTNSPGLSRHRGCVVSGGARQRFSTEEVGPDLAGHVRLSKEHPDVEDGLAVEEGNAACLGMTDQVCRVLAGPYKVLIVLTSKNPVAVVLQLLTMILHQTLDSLHTNLVEAGDHLSGGMDVIRQEAKRANLVQNVEAVG